MINFFSVIGASYQCSVAILERVSQSSMYRSTEETTKQNQISALSKNAGSSWDTFKAASSIASFGSGNGKLIVSVTNLVMDCISNCCTISFFST